MDGQKSVSKSSQKAKASEAKVEHLRRVLTKFETSLNASRSSLAEIKANMACAVKRDHT